MDSKQQIVTELEQVEAERDRLREELAARWESFRGACTQIDKNAADRDKLRAGLIRCRDLAEAALAKDEELDASAIEEVTIACLQLRDVPGKQS